MREQEFKEYLEAEGLTPKGVASRIARVKKVESLLGSDADSLVSDDKVFEKTLDQIKPGDHHGNLQNAMRKYYAFAHQKSYSAIDYNSLTPEQLLSMYSGVLKTLRSKGILRTNNAPTGDYGEWLVSQKLGLTLATNSKAHYDATDAVGIRYQIKAIKGQNRQCSAIREYDPANPNFDVLIVICFDDDFEVKEAYKMAFGAIANHAHYTAHTNSYTLTMGNKVITSPDVVDIIDQF